MKSGSPARNISGLGSGALLRSVAAVVYNNVLHSRKLLKKASVSCLFSLGPGLGGGWSAVARQPSGGRRS